MKELVERKAWRAMLARCNDLNHPAYKWYGGRAIRVCSRWQGSTGYKNFLSDMGVRPDGLSLDRKDNNKGYSPDNCRWVDQLVQQANRSDRRVIEVDGERRSLTEWARLRGIRKTLIWERLRRGWDPKSAVMTPSDQYRKRGRKVEL